jgi:hypothetical protein
MGNLPADRQVDKTNVGKFLSQLISPIKEVADRDEC